MGPVLTDPSGSDRELRLLAHVLWSRKGSGHCKGQVLHLQCSVHLSKEQGRHGGGQEQGDGSLLPKCLSDLVSGIYKLVKYGCQEKSNPGKMKLGERGKVLGLRMAGAVLIRRHGRVDRVLRALRTPEELTDAR